MHRLSHEEVGEVARLAAKRGIDRYGDGPSIQQASSLLGLPPEQVERLLAEVRQKAPVDPKALRSALIGLGGALAVLALIVAGTFVAGSLANRDAASKAPPQPDAGFSASASGGAAPYGAPIPSAARQPSNPVASTSTGSQPYEPGYTPAPKTPHLKNDETEMRRAVKLGKEFADSQSASVSVR